MSTAQTAEAPAQAPTLIAITLRRRPNGEVMAEAAWQGTTYRAASYRNAIQALARALVAAKVPDAPWTATDGGAVVVSGKSLHDVARLGADT